MTAAEGRPARPARPATGGVVAPAQPPRPRPRRQGRRHVQRIVELFDGEILAPGTEGSGA